MRLIAAASLAVLMVAACGQSSDAQQPTPPVAGQPLETRPPNGAGQAPAFAGQTRAPAQPSGVALDIQTVATGLAKPWAIEFLPDGRMLVTEKAGNLRVVSADGKISAPVAGLPAVDTNRQGGLLDVALDPGFAKSRLIYWSYAEGRPDGDGTAVARGRLSDDLGRVEQVQVIFRMQPTIKSGMHYGSRLVFAPDGKLFVTLGERSIPEGRRQAQDLNSHFGKVVRINADGSVPSDNPFVGRAGARPEIWSYGHRNIQSAALDAQGRLWEVEHGTRGGDELNLVQKGKDYGWPTIAYGIEYQGGPINQGITQKAGMEQPNYYWDPVIAPSGMLRYTGDLFPAWKDSFFVGGLSSKRLVRISLNGDRVAGEEHLLTDRDERYRDVAQGPDGAIYVITDADDGRLLKLTPRR